MRAIVSGRKVEQPTRRLPEDPAPIVRCGDETLEELQERSDIDALGRTQKWPVRCPHASIRRECLEQRIDVGPRILVEKRRARELDEARQLDEHALRLCKREQLPEAGLVEARVDGRPAAVVDQEPYARALDERRKRDQLVALHLQ